MTTTQDVHYVQRGDIIHFCCAAEDCHGILEPEDEAKHIFCKPHRWYITTMGIEPPVKKGYTKESWREMIQREREAQRVRNTNTPVTTTQTVYPNAQIQQFVDPNAATESDKIIATLIGEKQDFAERQVKILHRFEELVGGLERMARALDDTIRAAKRDYTT